MMPLSSQLQQHWQTVADRLPADFPVAELSPQARSVMAFSDFVEQSVIAQPGWLNELAQSSPEAEEWRHYEAWLQERLQAVADEAGLMRELRLFRRHMMVRIAWAQALSLVSEEETLQQLSVLAETLIVAARDWLYAACCKEWGTPCNAEGQPQPLLILGMGKLGGGELNFSSDIDLILPGPSMAPPAAAAASWITPSSLPAWGSGLSRRSTSRRRTALFIGWTCACGRLATAGRWCSALRRWRIITRSRAGTGNATRW